MTYAFFPGCSLDGAAKDYHRSTLAVAAIEFRLMAAATRNIRLR